MIVKHLLNKNLVFVLLFFCYPILIFGQLKEGKYYLSPAVQPSSEVHFKYAYSAASSIYIGQPFTFKATNVGVKGVRLTFDLVALTVCNKEVKQNFDIALDIKESKGFGNAFFDNEYIASVNKVDCEEGIPIEYLYKGKMLKGKNRIKDVYVKNLIINPLPEKLAVSANGTPNDLSNDSGTKTKKELADEERLNQSMMKKLEKDFDEDRKSKKSEADIEPVVNEDVPNDQGEVKNVNKKSNKVVDAKIQMYKDEIANALGNFSIAYSHTEVHVLNGNKTKNRVKDEVEYNSCKWIENTLIIKGRSTVWRDSKKEFSSVFEKKIDLKKSKSETVIVKFDGNNNSYPYNKNLFYTENYDYVIWTLQDKKESYSWFIESIDQQFIETLKPKFDYIILNIGKE